MSDYHREVRSLCLRAEEAERASANIEERFESAFFYCRPIDQVMGPWSAAFGQFLER